MSNQNVYINGKSLDLETVKSVARGYARVAVSRRLLTQVKAGNTVLKDKIRNKIRIYGVTTGFGEFSQVFIKPALAAKLQQNLIRSHATGVGKPADEDIVRATMLCRANYLASGLSGCRPVILQTLLEMLNRRVTPLVLKQGSVGSSGDLAPLSMMSLVLTGEGEAFFGGDRMPGKIAMQKAGIKTVKLQAKEGLALINGDTFMVGMGMLELCDALELAKVSEIACAMTMEAIEVVKEALDNRIAKARRYIGQRISAANIRMLLDCSQILDKPPSKVQDAYSIRCAPVILGAGRESLAWIKRQFYIESNAAQDNPLVFADTGDVLSGGNFHGQPICMPLELMAMTVQEYANASEIRQERMNNPYYSKILPAFLIPNGGINSGFMMPQYASAALVNENKILCYPGIVDSIPVSAGQEDDCSMGTNAALKIIRIIRNTRYVLAIELMMGAQAMEFKKGRLPGTGSLAAYGLIRESVPYIRKDTVMYPYVEKIQQLIKDGSLVNSVEAAVGRLQEVPDYEIPD